MLLPLLLVGHSLAAQNQSGRRGVGGDPPVELHGIVHAAYDSFAPQPQSLKELVKAADVIVEGRVESLMGRLHNIDDSASVETDAIFAVDRVLKGQPESLRTLVVTQMSGKYGNVGVVVAGLTRLNQGDQHILFLNYDRRPIVPTYPRTDGNFMIVAQWMGNFGLQGNAVKWLSPSNAEAFRKFENGTAEHFIAQIIAEVSAVQ